jgi:DNA-binding GntR family transcriptional regulator
MILKLEKLTLGAQIADQMRDAILKGEIAPGAAIVETSLAQQFGVSRGPLREAIRQLIGTHPVRAA